MDTTQIKLPAGYRHTRTAEERSRYEGMVFCPTSGMWFPTAGEPVSEHSLVVIPSDEDVRLENVHRAYRHRRNLMIFMLIVGIPFCLRIGWMLCDYFLNR